VSIELRIKQAKSNSNGWNSEYGGFPIDPGFGLQKSDISNTSDQKSEVFPVTGIGLQRWILEVTRGQVDNENNSQSQYSNISNNIQSAGLIYKSESIAIRNRL